MESVQGPIKPFIVGRLPKEKYSDVNELARDIAAQLAIDEEKIEVNILNSEDIKGEKGDKGDPGLAIRGPQGEPGGTGPTGNTGPGLSWEGPWALATDYAINDLAENGGAVYISVVQHTSDADSEPGVGVDWNDYWDLFPMNPFNVGVDDASSAAAGEIGEYAETVVLAGAPVSLTNATPANLATLSLTAGDWDVWGTLTFVAAAATVTELAGGIGVVSATLPTRTKYSGILTTTTSFKDSIVVPGVQINTSGTGNVFIVAQATFSAGTVDVYGEISARRRR